MDVYLPVVVMVLGFSVALLIFSLALLIGLLRQYKKLIRR